MRICGKSGVARVFRLDANTEELSPFSVCESWALIPQVVCVSDRHAGVCTIRSVTRVRMLENMFCTYEW